MRRILVDSARRNRQLKRGGDQERVELCDTRIAAPVEDEKLLPVNEALDALAREDPMKAEVVKLQAMIVMKSKLKFQTAVCPPTVSESVTSKRDCITLRV
jgi:ECF sigma factor